jgi:hypothetical protein
MKSMLLSRCFLCSTVSLISLRALSFSSDPSLNCSYWKREDTLADNVVPNLCLSWEDASLSWKLWAQTIKLCYFSEYYRLYSQVETSYICI